VSSREQGNIWPVISVAGGAFFVLVIMPLILHRERNARMATVEPQVTIGDAGNNSTTGANRAMYRWPDSEVPRTAERLRDVTAIAIASSSYVAEAAMRGHVPANDAEVMSEIARRQLIPNQWLTDKPNILQTAHATIHFRYSRTNLEVEVISAPVERTDGPAMLIRIPDRENIGVSARYFESVQLDGILYPSPFAPIPQIIASGWQPRPFKQTQIPDEQRAQLEAWAKTAASK
jgi:hypothetical protein